jgi:hypothetical protein
MNQTGHRPSQRATRVHARPGRCGLAERPMWGTIVNTLAGGRWAYARWLLVRCVVSVRTRPMRGGGLAARAASQTMCCGRAAHTQRRLGNRDTLSFERCRGEGTNHTMIVVPTATDACSNHGDRLDLVTTSRAGLNLVARQCSASCTPALPQRFGPAANPVDSRMNLSCRTQSKERNLRTSPLAIFKLYTIK